MTIVFPSQKTPKTSFWTEVSDKRPADEEALYLVVQEIEGQKILGFAYYRKDGNGEFNFTKEHVAFWAPAPAFPQ